MANRRAWAVALALFATAFASRASAVQKLLAVLPLDVTAANGHLTKAGEKLLEEMVRDMAANALPGWTVLTGDTTIQLLQDNGVDPTKCTEASCHLAMARQLEADKFISGVVMFVDGEFTASIRLMDTKSGRILASTEVTGGKTLDLRRDFEAKAADFFGRLEPGGGNAVASGQGTTLPANADGAAPAPPPAPAVPTVASPARAALVMHGSALAEEKAAWAAAPPVHAPRPSLARTAPAVQCPAGLAMLDWACKPTKMKLCSFGGTYAFCNDQDGDITENAFIRRYQSVTGEHNLDKDYALRHGLIGPAILTALGTAGAIFALGTSAFHCTQSDIANGMCPVAAASGTCPTGKSCINITGVMVAVGAVCVAVAGLGWGTYAITDPDGAPDDHNIGPDLARASVEEYNRKLPDASGPAATSR